MTYYTYAYLDHNNKPYYIGKGKGRRAYHKNHTVERPSKDKIIFLKTGLTEENALKHEAYLINILPNLQNVAGYGFVKGTAPLTKEHKGKISKAMKVSRAKQIITQEHKDSMRASIKSHWDSLTDEERKQRIQNFVSPPTKTFIIDGKKFDGISSICEYYGLRKSVVCGRIYSKSPKWSNWSLSEGL